MVIININNIFKINKNFDFEILFDNKLHLNINLLNDLYCINNCLYITRYRSTSNILGNT